MGKRLFEYVDYDKISDDIYYLGGMSRLILRMNVSLGKKKDDGSRMHFYREFSHDSRYTDKGDVLSIKRSYDYYLTLESLDNPMSGIMIRPQDMIIIQNKLNAVNKWFSEIFVIKGKKLQITKNKRIVIDGFPNRKAIMFEPTIIEWEDGIQSQGVRISISDYIYSDITIDNFYGFLYIMNTFNMVQSAQMMLAFIGKPPIGTNYVSINAVKQRDIPNRNTQRLSSNNGKVPPVNKSSSYFDRE